MLFAQGFIWYFFDVPKEIIKGWKNYLVFNLEYFSVPTLIKTFFWHWRGYYYPYGKQWNPMRYAEAFVFNVLMSRLAGVVFRTVLIIVGVATEIIVFLLGLIIFLGWFILPLLIITGFFLGIGLLV